MGGVFSESVEAYSESDLRDAAHRFRFRATGCPLNMEDLINDEVESLLKAKRIKPTFAQRRDIAIAVEEHDIANIRAAAESAGLDFHAVCQIERRALLGMLSRAMHHDIVDPIDVQLMERRLRGPLGGDGLVESVDEAWSRVKQKLKIYSPRSRSDCPKAATSCRPIFESARKPGPEITLPVSKISPAVWVALEKKLGVYCNTSLWEESTRLLFLTDLDSIVLDDADAPPIDVSTQATAHTAPPSQTRFPASGSIVAREMTAADFDGHVAPQVPCRFCGSMWPSTVDCACHRAYCTRNPDSPSFLRAGATNDGKRQKRCANCGTGFADAGQRAKHETHCVLNIWRPPPNLSSHSLSSIDPPEQSTKVEVAFSSQLFPCQHCGRTFGSRRTRGAHKAHCPKNPTSRAHRASLETNEAPNADAEHRVAPKRRPCHVELAAAALGLLDLTRQGEATRERQRAAVVHAVWDMRVIRAWSSVDWGEAANHEIVCFLIWRNIDFAVKSNYVSEQAIQCFLEHFGAPPEYQFRAAMWDSVLDLLFKEAPEVIEQKLHTFFNRDIPTGQPRFLLL